MERQSPDPSSNSVQEMQDNPEGLEEARKKGTVVGVTRNGQNRRSREQ